MKYSLTISDVLGWVLLSCLACSCQQQEVSLLTAPIELTPDNRTISLPTLTDRYQLVHISLQNPNPYANLSLVARDRMWVDNMDIPDTGHFSFTFLADVGENPAATLHFQTTQKGIIIEQLSLSPYQGPPLPHFVDISQESGLETESTWKYGGPTVADIDADGDYDFVLNNHDKVPAKLFWNEGNGRVKEHEEPLMHWDIHGSAAGDYDRDGDLDILISQGGGNGTNPQPPHLLRNDGGTFTEVTKEAGILLGSRGRSARWLDMDQDGDLDLLLVNAEGINTTDSAQHILYQNLGDGTFEAVKGSKLEKAPGERLLITDLNNDHLDDIVLFSPLSIWLGKGDFQFEDVSEKWLPASARQAKQITGAAYLDLENDGDQDLYLSQGLPYYFLANKSLDFHPEKGRIDLRDEGNKGRRSIDFYSDGPISLSNIFLWYRLYDGGFPVFVGENKVLHLPQEGDSLTFTPEQAKGWASERTQNGWYLGFLGEGKWRLEWVKNANIYWGIRISISMTISGVKAYETDWIPQNRNLKDLLLRNEGDHFTDISASAGIPQGGNHEGVTVGDFNNDGFEDLFLYRFGYLRKRVTDWLLLNDGQGHFLPTTTHSATDPGDPGHGDMGQAFDMDLDGDVDLLNGSDNPGKWYLYANQTSDNQPYVLCRVEASPREGIDPYGAVVEVHTSTATYKKRIGSAGAVHSQSLLNIVHFGLGEEPEILRISVRWRNGETLIIETPKASTLHVFPQK